MSTEETQDCGPLALKSNLVLGPLPDYIRDELPDDLAAQRVQAWADARVASERDCRTCHQFRGTLHCHSVLRCVDGSSYQRGGVVQLWETAPVDAGF